MSFAREDEVRARRLLHAYAATHGLRGSDAAAELILGAPALDAVDRLRSASANVAAERADDGPARAGRDRAADALVSAVQGAVRLLRARASAAALGPNGEICAPEFIESCDALIAEFFPHGRPSRMPRAGAPLQLFAERFADGLAALDYETIAAKLRDPLSAHAAALDLVAMEEQELGSAQLALVKARAEVDRLVRAGAAYVAYKVEIDDTIGLSADEVFPPIPRGSPEEDNEALDEAGVDPLEDPDEGRDDTMDTGDED